MPSRKTPRSNIYRQLDPSVNNNRGSNPNAGIILVRASSPASATVTLFFDQPIIATGAPIGPPSWTVGARTFASFGTLSPDGLSLEVTFSGTCNAGDLFDFPITGGGIPYVTALSGTIDGSSGTVADPTAAPNTFDIASVELIGVDTVVVHFDAPVAAVAPAFNADLTGLVVSGATHWLIQDHGPDENSITLFSTSGTTTSGAAWTAAAPFTGQFISLTAARLNAGSGTAT